MRVSINDPNDMAITTVLLMTDGEANQGITTQHGIIQEMKAISSEKVN